MIIKKVVLLNIFMLCFMLNSMAFAENIAAENYRKLINSGDFYIEYEIVNEDYVMMMPKNFQEAVPKNIHSYAMKNGVIMVKSNINNANYLYTRKISKLPDLYIAAYKDNKLYAFYDNKEAYRYDDELKNLLSDLGSMIDYHNQNSTTQFTVVNQAASTIYLPDYFKVFLSKDCTNDYLASRLQDDKIPSYKESTTITENGITYEVDIYENSSEYTIANIGVQKKIKSNTVVQVYYNNGVLMKIKYENGLNWGGATTVNINKFSEPLFEQIAMPKGCTVYKVSSGDMDSLLKNKIVIEQY